MQNVKKHISLAILSLFYLLAGANHFWHPSGYMAIMPPWLPRHALLVAVSGIFEIALGIFVLVPAARNAAVWGIIMLLLAVWPANVQMMLQYAHQHDRHLWLAVLRVPFQAVLIWWAWSVRIRAKKPRMAAAKQWLRTDILRSSAR